MTALKAKGTMELLNKIKIPKGSTLSVKDECGKILIVIEPEEEEPRTVKCERTECEEELPKIGDLAIMWNNNHREAIISRVNNEEMDSMPYQAKNGEWYKNAIRFRDEEQYLKVLGILL